MEPLDVLRALLCADAARPPPFDSWDRPSWQELVDEAERLDAGAMLYSALRRVRALDLLPPDHRARLRGVYAATSAQNMRLVSEANRLLAAFAEAGIRVVPLKGVALFLGGVLRDEGARPTVDIDLLTHRRDRDRVVELLGRLGYDQPGRPNPPKHLGAFRRDDLMVEVHEQAYWSTRGGAVAGLDEMSDPAGRARLDRTFVHLVHHLFESSVPVPQLIVKTLWDANEIRVRAEQDPELFASVVSLAESAGLSGQLGRIQHALAKVLDRPAPPGVEARAEDVDALLVGCEPTDEDYIRAMHLVYYVKLLRTQPLDQKVAVLRHLLSRGNEAEEPWLRRTVVYGARSLQLVGRVVAAAGRLARGRAARKRS